jgi:leader peptidase (prepilin peptidase)/N-methyltransferase
VRLLFALAVGAIGGLAGLLLARSSVVLHRRHPSRVELFGRVGEGASAVGRRRLLFCSVTAAALFFLAALHWGASARLLPNLFLLAVLVVMSAVDLEHQLIPNRLVFPSLAVSVAAVAVASVVDGTPSSVRYAAVGGVAYFVGLLAAHLANPAGMGLGDVKLALLLGWFVGWSADGFGNALFLVLLALLVASLLGSVIGVALLVRRGRGAHYPFGPWLALGTVVVLLVTPVASS